MSHVLLSGPAPEVRDHIGQSLSWLFIVSDLSPCAALGLFHKKFGKHR